jgi:hypothetical protein
MTKGPSFYGGALGGQWRPSRLSLHFRPWVAAGRLSVSVFSCSSLRIVVCIIPKSPLDLATTPILEPPYRSANRTDRYGGRSSLGLPSLWPCLPWHNSFHLSLNRMHELSDIWLYVTIQFSSLYTCSVCLN